MLSSPLVSQLRLYKALLCTVVACSLSSYLYSAPLDLAVSLLWAPAFTHALLPLALLLP